MIKLPFFQRQKDKFSVSLDIGTEAAKVLFFSLKEEREKGKVVNILGSSLHYFDSYGIFDGYHFDEKIIQRALDGAIREAFCGFQRVIGKEVKDWSKLSAIISLPANIIKSRIVFQSLKREKIKDVISRKEEGIIRQRVLESVRLEVSQVYGRESGILSKDIHFIALKVLEAKIDGYEVPALQGYDGKNLNFRILAIFLPADYLKTIKNITDSLGLKNAKITHSAQNLLHSSYLSKRSDGIFLDIGGSLTQIFLLNRGKLEQTEEFEMGGRAFSRALSDSLGLNMKSARILKEDYCKGVLSEQVRKRIREIFLRPSAEWFNNLRFKLSARKSFLASTFFLCGGGSLLPEIQEILERGNWKEAPIIAPPEVQFIYPKDLPDIIDKTNSLNSPKDISPILICFS